MKKNYLALLLSLAMVFSLVPGIAIAETINPLVLPAPTSTFSVKTTDGLEIPITAWEDIVYVEKPTDIIFHFPPIPNNPVIETTQLLNIYVPANANSGSPIILFVDNGGWMTNTKPVKLKAGDVLPATGGNADEMADSFFDPVSMTWSTPAAGGKAAAIAEALKSGYLVVTYSGRGRNDSPIDGEYLGHSPATMTDTKAVIRYLRYNDALLPGDSEKIVVTGSSGGGALTSIIAASGDSSDYYPSLFEIGAAGMTSATTSTISDSVFAAIPYCPITDLTNADQAYEFIFNGVRNAFKDADLSLEDVNPNPNAMGAPTSTDQIFGESVLDASDALAADYVDYFNSLNLKDEDGNLLKADDGSFVAALTALMEKAVEKELTTKYPSSDPSPLESDFGWLTVENGKATIDWDDFLYWIGTEKTGLKTAPAFSNKGTPNQHPALNEDNIFGTKEDPYSPFEFWSWNNHTAEGVAVGKNNTGLDWDEYMLTDEGLKLALQSKMTNPIPYLLSESEGTSAPYWYVRHGMTDRDTSFAVEATLYYALLNDNTVKDLNFNFAWLKDHSGDYDVPEVYAWLADVLAGEGYVSNPFVDVSESNWFYNAVKFVNQGGLMNGTSANTFSPDQTTTRGMIVTILYRLEGSPSVGANPFTDVAADQWYTNAVAWALENDVVKGYENNLFGPNDPITREQMALILNNYAALKEYDVSARANLADFTDSGNISSWAQEALSWANADGLITGRGNNLLAPKGNAARSEIATILMRFLDK